MIGPRIGMGLLMIGLVTGLGPKMTGIIGAMIGLEDLRIDGMLSSRVSHWDYRDSGSEYSKTFQDCSKRETWNNDESVC